MRILTVAIVVLCLSGVLVSTLALKEHYNTEASPCSINEVWDCGVVNKSPYAVFHGIPVAIVGAMGYALLAVIAGRLRWLTVIAAAVGCAFALYLTSIEARKLHVWCMYCVASQIIIATVLVLALILAVVARHRSTAA
jgi:uncharacterized membrane protein